MDDRDFKRWIEQREIKYLRTFKLKFELDSDNRVWKPFYLINKEKSMSYTWSFSSLKEYINCPRQYNELKNLKNYEKKQSEQMLYGSEVHKALEDYTRSGVELAKNYQRFKPMIDALLAIPGTKYPEYEMALTREKEPCDFNDENRWVRGIVDLLIVDGDYGFIVDYKTGNDKYPDRDQLILMSLMVFAHFPHIRQVNSALLFVVKNSMVKHKMTIDDKDFHWWRYRERVAKLANSFANNVWNPTQTPLCNWCDVKTCEFNPKH